MARLMVLGLLKMKPMSGYEIQQLLIQTKSDAWAGILPGSIYHALKKMETEKLVEISAIEQTGNRSKAIYSITEQGEQQFLELLRNALQASSVQLPSELYTAISFIKALDKTEVIASLQQQRTMVLQELEQQKAGISVKQEHMQVDPVVELLFGNLVKQYELQLELLNGLIKQYEQLEIK